MNPTLDPAQARAMLNWLIEAGADEALSETPIDRFAVAAEVSVPTPVRAPVTPTPARLELPRTAAVAVAPPSKRSTAVR